MDPMPFLEQRRRCDHEESTSGRTELQNARTLSWCSFFPLVLWGHKDWTATPFFSWFSAQVLSVVAVDLGQVSSAPNECGAQAFPTVWWKIWCRDTRWCGKNPSFPSWSQSLIHPLFFLVNHNGTGDPTTSFEPISGWDTAKASVNHQIKS